MRVQVRQQNINNLAFVQTNGMEFDFLCISGQFKTFKKLFLIRIPSVYTHLILVANTLETRFVQKHKYSFMIHILVRRIVFHFSSPVFQ